VQLRAFEPGDAVEIVFQRFADIGPPFVAGERDGAGQPLRGNAGKHLRHGVGGLEARERVEPAPMRRSLGDVGSLRRGTRRLGGVGGQVHAREG